MATKRHTAEQIVRKLREAELEAHMRDLGGQLDRLLEAHVQEINERLRACGLGSIVQPRET